MTKDKYGSREARRYENNVREFGADADRVDRAAHEALDAIEGDEAGKLRAAEAEAKARLKEEDPELYREAEDLPSDLRIRAYERAVDLLEEGHGHADAIRMAIEEVKQSRGGTRS